MPELPDVEIFRRRLEAHARGRAISAVHILDKRLLDAVSAARLSCILEDSRVVSTARHGKHLFVELDNGSLLVLHFGMTGEILTLGRGAGTPRYTALRLAFNDGSGVAITSRRRLGHIALAKDASAFIRSHELGPDALDPTLDIQAFQAALGSPRSAIKSALMDQSKLAGIGNIYSDEILFQAGLGPTVRVGDLNYEQRNRLFQTMRRVLKEAVERGVLSEGTTAALPGDWLLGHRAKGERCPHCGTAVQASKVAGRSCYFCPSCQVD